MPASHSRHNQSRHQEHKPCRTTSVHVRDAGGTLLSPQSCPIMHIHARTKPRTREQVGKRPTDKTQQTADRRVRRAHTQPANFTQKHHSTSVVIVCRRANSALRRTQLPELQPHQPLVQNPPTRPNSPIGNAPNCFKRAREKERERREIYRERRTLYRLERLL